MNYLFKPQNLLPNEAHAILEVKEHNRDWNITLNTYGRNIVYKLDTGAQVNLLPISEVNKFKKKPKLQRTLIKLSAYNGSEITVLGKVDAVVSIDGKKLLNEFIVVEENFKPILGLNM